jgi:hypothetical protein
MVTQLEKPTSKRSAWTEEEINFLKANYKTMLGRELVAILGKSIGSIRMKAKALGIRKKELPWTDRELQYLEDNYGLRPVEAIARKLGRSKNALKIVSYRKLHGLNQRSNIYTARSTAEILGVR